MKVFNIHIEFEPQRLCSTIEEFISKKKKACVCVVDANVLTVAQKNPAYRKVVNDADINACDGSSIAKMVNSIYGTNYSIFTGPMLFERYIERPYRHVLLGNTRQKVDQIKAKVAQKGMDADLTHVDVPFVPVEEFDYPAIAKQINELKPDIVWVSLGAPKQETFIHNILPYVDQGVFLGIGAAFNFYTSDLHDIKTQIGGLKLNWLERILREPRKQLRRVGGILMTVPGLYIEEKRRFKKIKA